MATIKQGNKKRLNMAERAKQAMEVMFPDAPIEWIWYRQSNHGFSSVPRTLPIAMQAIDMQSAKGQPAGHTLFCLWARSPDHPLVMIDSPATFASEAGFTGERAIDTWRRRMKKLKELRFIITRKGPSGDFHYVLLTNPNAALEWMRQKELVQDLIYARFLDRALEIGAYRDIESLREYLKKEEEEKAAEEAAARSKTKTSGK